MQYIYTSSYIAMENLSLIIISSFIFIVFIIFKLVIKSIHKSKLPPGPWKLPILGNLHQIAGKIPHLGLRELAQKYGPLMHLQLGEISAIVISNSRLAKEVLRTQDVALADRPTMYLSTITFANCRGIVLARYGEYWRQMRKICTLELLSANKVRSFQSIREEEAWQLVQSIKSSSSGGLVNVSDKVSRLSNSITCRSTIGQKCKHQDELIELVEEIAHYGSGFYMADLFKSWKIFGTLSGMKPALHKVKRKLDIIFESIIKEHTEKLSNRKLEGSEVVAEEEEDLVDVLLRINQSQRLEFPITSGDIQVLVVEMLTAGTDTSSAVLEWAMSELMRNPKVMKKLQSEVREVGKGKQNLEETDIQKMSYLKLVIKETLRLHAPVPLLLPRECRKECVIDGYTVPVGTKVIINAWAIGRDPNYWVDAESFIPERFDNSSVDYIGANFEFIPFGAGRRMCAGLSFGVDRRVRNRGRERESNLGLTLQSRVFERARYTQILFNPDHVSSNGTISGGINQEGIDFYNNFIDELIKNGITPVVTLFHFDLPQALQDKYSGFLNKHIVDDFKAYADLCFKTFGDRVKYWNTINEPQIFGQYVYKIGLKNPGPNPVTDPFLATHHIILAHAAAAKHYKQCYQAAQQGEIGISLVAIWYEPHGDTRQDIDAAERAFDFMVGWLLEPIVHGDYPFIMKALVRDGPPEFTDEEESFGAGFM